MNKEIAGTFIYNGSPQNGATAKLWQITGFASYGDSGDDVQDNPLSATSIVVNVTSGGTFAIGDIIKIDSELMRIWDIRTNALYVVRGYRGTTAASHTNGTTIYDETITEPQQDDSEPGGGYQQGGSLTTGVAYGGDGAYRWTGVPAGEYYVSVYYDSHRAFIYAFVEQDDPSPLELLTVRGDLLTLDANGLIRLPKGSSGQYLRVDSGGNDLEWGSPSANPFSTQSVVTGSRALGTQYQNTSGQAMLVLASVSYATAVAAVIGYTGAASASTEVVRKSTNSSSIYTSITFVVLNNYYYKVTLSQGTLYLWVEYT